jgi:hypothetical protein
MPNLIHNLGTIGYVFYLEYSITLVTESLAFMRAAMATIPLPPKAGGSFAASLHLQVCACWELPSESLGVRLLKMK